MNKWIGIGNLTRDPELRATSTGIPVCSFTIAVNRPRRDGQEQGADFFRISVWRQLGESCAKYLAKGRKCAVTGPVSVSTYEGKDYKTHAQMDVTAESVEFLTPAAEGAQQARHTSDVPDGFTQVDEDELPF
jgi:single-strand DNA-binding protein